MNSLPPSSNPINPKEVSSGSRFSDPSSSGLIGSVTAQPGTSRATHKRKQSIPQRFSDGLNTSSKQTKQNFLAEQHNNLNSELTLSPETVKAITQWENQKISAGEKGCSEAILHMSVSHKIPYLTLQHLKTYLPSIINTPPGKDNCKLKALSDIVDYITAEEAESQENRLEAVRRAHSLSKHDDCKKLDLSGLSLSKLPPNIPFHYCEDLNIKNNNFKYIPKNTVAQLSKLKKLNVSQNPFLQTLNLRTLDNLTHLKALENPSLRNINLSSKMAQDSIELGVSPHVKIAYV